jgi:hypothetical protein
MKKIIDYIKELRYELLKNDLLDNNLIDDRLLYEIINQQRALWIKNELNKGRSIEDNIRQTINGIEVVPVDDSTFDRFNTKDRVLISRQQIPRTIELHHRDNILTVRSSKFSSEKFNYIHRDKFTFTGNNRFTKKAKHCTLYNNHIYIKVQKDDPKIALLTNISIEGVFENPIDVYMMTEKALKNNYDPREEIYPISLAMWTYIKGTILQMDAKLLIQAQQINSNANTSLQ